MNGFFIPLLVLVALLGQTCSKVVNKEGTKSLQTSLRHVFDALKKRNFIKGGIANSQMKKHFRRQANTACPGPEVLSLEYSTISRPVIRGEGLKYADNLDCSWMIRAPQGKFVALQTLTFAVEDSEQQSECEESCQCPYDYLQVGGVKYCGKTGPNKTYQKDSLLVKFVSDDSGNFAGFQLAFYFVDAAGGGGDIEPGGAGSGARVTCGAAITASSGATFSSPNYPNNYADNIACAWTITASAGKVVVLGINDLDIEGGTNSGTCPYDVLTVYDGPDASSSVITNLCNSNGVNGPIFSTGSSLYVAFNTDHSVQRRGFLAEVSEKGSESVLPEACTSGPQVLTDREGSFASPLEAGGRYPNNLDCSWLIYPNSGQEQVHLEFVSFNIEEEAGCIYDSVQTYDVTSDGATAVPLGKYCGGFHPAVSSSVGNQLRVQFTTDGSVTLAGFTAKYSSKRPSVPGGSDVQCGVADIKPQGDRIVGGREAVPHSWPWQVSVRLHDNHWCGGSVLSKDLIITAAHCLVDSSGETPASSLKVIAGAHMRVYDTDAEPSRQIKQVTEVIVHADYVNNGPDIALLRLESDLEWTAQVKPICVPTQAVEDSKLCATSGWGATHGKTEDDSTNDVLQFVYVPMVSHTTCNSEPYYNGVIDESHMVCAGYREGGKDSCQGDSGGPLVCDRRGVYELQGVTSWGWGCADPLKPGVYARVPALREWIKTNSGGNFYENNNT